MQIIKPCLWFDNQAEEAANFYVSLFKDAKVDRWPVTVKPAPKSRGARRARR